MAYIGKQPTVGNFVKLDAIVTSATATYNLLNGGVAYSPQSANHCIVSLNGVIQSPTTSFTISGSTIVFTSALTSLDVIDFILVLGDVLNIGTPSDGTVTFPKVTSNLITGATAETTIAGGDSVLIYDDSASALRKMTRTNFVSGLGGVSNSFQAVGTGGAGNITGALAINTELHDDGGNYNTANGRYTAPSTGYYIFFASALIDGASGTDFYFTKNGSAVSASNSWGYNGVSNQNQLNTYGILSLTSGDYVNIFSSQTVYVNQYLNFGGAKLY